MENSYDLIVSIVNRGYSDPVVEASREAGASGGTIIYGRGTKSNEAETFMGISIQPEKEIIMTLTRTEKKNSIMEAISKRASMSTAGKGICFSLPVTEVRGLSNSNSTKEKPAKTKVEEIDKKEGNKN